MIRPERLLTPLEGAPVERLRLLQLAPLNEGHGEVADAGQDVRVLRPERLLRPLEVAPTERLRLLQLAPSEVRDETMETGASYTT